MAASAADHYLVRSTPVFTVGKTRTEADSLAPGQQTLATDPVATMALRQGLPKKEG